MENSSWTVLPMMWAPACCRSNTGVAVYGAMNSLERKIAIKCVRTLRTGARLQETDQRGRRSRQPSASPGR